MNVVILQGHLSRPPSARTLPSGDELTTFQVTTRPPDDGPAETVPVAWLEAPRQAAEIPAGAEVLVTGRVRRRYFKAAGATASRTEVVADGVVPIGRRATASRLLAAAVATAGAVADPAVEG